MVYEQNIIFKALEYTYLENQCKYLGTIIRSEKKNGKIGHRNSARSKNAANYGSWHQIKYPTKTTSTFWATQGQNFIRLKGPGKDTDKTRTVWAIIAL